MAKKLATDDKLVIAKFDATANDPPEKYTVEVSLLSLSLSFNHQNPKFQGFPTLYFAPKGKKEHPIKYSGNRGMDDMIKFMKDNKVASFAKQELWSLFKLVRLP